jgi:ATP-dependent Clp protease ATP-binding subunit ClpA
MTAKEKLREVVDALSEEEAREALRYLGSREFPDSVRDLLDEAPEGTEPTTEGEEAELREARAEVAHGETVSLEELRRDFA